MKKINKFTETSALASIITDGLKVNVVVPKDTIIGLSVACVLTASLIIFISKLSKLIR